MPSSAGTTCNVAARHTMGATCSGNPGETRCNRCSARCSWRAGRRQIARAGKAAGASRTVEQRPCSADLLHCLLVLLLLQYLQENMTELPLLICC